MGEALRLKRESLGFLSRCPCVDSATNRNDYRKYFRGCGGGVGCSLCTADKFTTSKCRLQEILEASPSLKPHELSTPLQRLLCHTCPLPKTVTQIFNFCHIFWESRTGLICRLAFRRVVKVAKIVYSFRHVSPSICPSACTHGTTQFPMNGFSLKFIFQYFSKKSLENLSSIKVGQE